MCACVCFFFISLLHARQTIGASMGRISYKLGQRHFLGLGRIFHDTHLVTKLPVDVKNILVYTKNIY
jgi:hypothetical protein